MKIDGNEKERAAIAAIKRGDTAEGNRLQDEFVAEFRASRETEDYCTCVKKGCEYHGNCTECVAIHRAHMDHLPQCFRPMVNEQVRAMSALTEHTALD